MVGSLDEAVHDALAKLIVLEPFHRDFAELSAPTVLRTYAHVLATKPSTPRTRRRRGSRPPRVLCLRVIVYMRVSMFVLK